MARRKKPDASAGPGAPLWMATYGDMITLVLTFFVLLFSFSTIDATKWKQIVMAFSGSKSVLPGVGDNILAGEEPEVMPDQQQEEAEGEAAAEEDSASESSGSASDDDAEWKQLADSLADYASGNGLAAQVLIEYLDTEITIRFEENVLFDSGKAVLRTEGGEILSKLFARISPDAGKLAFIRIEGHTDNVPIKTSQFADNWDLSQARASAVLRHILDGFPEIGKDQFFIGGYGEYHPIDTNDTPVGRSRNRRVDIVLVRPAKVADPARR